MNLLVQFFKRKNIFNIDIICGYFSDLDTVLSLKNFFVGIGCSNFNYVDNLDMGCDFRFSFLLNKTLVSLESISYCLFIGTNLRLESPLLTLVYEKIF